MEAETKLTEKQEIKLKIRQLAATYAIEILNHAGVVNYRFYSAGEMELAIYEQLKSALNLNN